MRGISSTAWAVTPASRSSTTVACSVVVDRNEMADAPRRSRRIEPASSGWTDTTTSASVSASGSMMAPAAAYSSSEIRARCPASGSTATSYPRPVSLPTSSGTIATRDSPSRVSLATAIFTRLKPGHIRRHSHPSHRRPGVAFSTDSPGLAAIVRDVTVVPRPDEQQDRHGLSPQSELLHRLVAGSAAGSFTEVRRHEGEVVDGPGGAAVAVEQAHPAAHLLRLPDPGDRDVGAEPLAVDRHAGAARRGAGARRQPGQLGVPVVVHVEPRPDHPGPRGARKGAAAGDRRLEGGTTCSRAPEPLDEVVQPPVGHLREERHGDVQVLHRHPPEPAGGAAYLQERVEVLHHLGGRHHGREHPHDRPPGPQTIGPTRLPTR